MNTPTSCKYQPTSRLAEHFQESPSEEQLQALWFESWHRPKLKTDEGQEVEIIQPGNWNHGAGPDFLQAAVRHADGRLAIGAVEIHRHSLDWDAHGHHVDPVYNDTILHVSWEPPAKTYFPTTQNFRQVPQVILKDQLIAPWDSLHDHLSVTTQNPLPSAQPGLCQPQWAHQAPECILEILRAAGIFRLRHKSQRLGWKVDAVGLRQTLWESLSEGLGYSGNKTPFRLISQRLPASRLSRFPRDKQRALLFGLSGLLPATSLADFGNEVRQWIRPQWELWWKLRDQYSHAILPRDNWKLSGLRPWNRPERRLAALSSLLPLLPQLEKTIAAGDDSAFTKILDQISDPFWDTHTTFRANALSKPHHLLGSERISDLVINVFWPLVCHRDSATAEAGWSRSESAPNKISDLVRQRILGTINLKPFSKETLIQQGLIQIYNDYCGINCSACSDCLFPEMITRWKM